ncbi:O-glucosyltransferase Rumi [Tanacetum coccineum]
MEHNWYDEESSISRSKRLYRYVLDTIWLPILSGVVTATSRSSVRVLFFVIFMFVAAALSTRLLDATVSSIAETPLASSVQTTKTVNIEPIVTPVIPENPVTKQPTETVINEPTITQVIPKKPPKKIEIPLKCSLDNLNKTCPAAYYPKQFEIQDLEYVSDPPLECPEYSVDYDVSKAKEETREALKRWFYSHKEQLNIRLVKIERRALFETYENSFQSRYIFTHLGILQYFTEILPAPNAPAPPPLFRYCALMMSTQTSFSQMWSFVGYKIYIEGSAWSVSDKYILACDSVTFVVKPRYYDFFTRGLMPVHHYWPIKKDDKCRSIKFAVDWGNSHKQKAQSIGKAASNFIQDDLKMDRVYDYMLHLLTEYSKLLKYKPTIPKKAVELCSESMACSSQGFEKDFMMESLIKGPAQVHPCTMPPPYEPQALKSLSSQKNKLSSTSRKMGERVF